MFVLLNINSVVVDSKVVDLTSSVTILGQFLTSDDNEVRSKGNFKNLKILRLSSFGYCF